MADFTPITINSQEEMDNLFKERIARAERKYSGFISPEDFGTVKADYEAKLEKAAKDLSDSNDAQSKNLEELQSKIADYEKQIAEKDSIIQANELSKRKTAIALKMGIPAELSERLNGSTEEEITADAEKFLSVFPTQTNHSAAPLRNPETKPEEDGVTAAFRKLNPKLKY